MAVIHWVGGFSTHFGDAANWNPAQVPGASDDAVIDLPGVVAVDSGTNITINSLSLIATASLTILGGSSFTVNNGTNGAGIAGTLTVNDNATLAIGGTIVNSGTIAESSAGTTTVIKLEQISNVLQGGGKVVLSANTSNQIFGASANFELDNVDNTISGGGNIGNGQMVLSNEGTINADQAGAALTVNTAGNVITNTGVMEATLGGDLNILSAVNNVGGTIEAVGAGSVVFLQANVTGGTVLASGGGVVQTSGNSGQLDGLGLHPVTNGSAIQVLNGQVLTLFGNIINNSSINLNAASNSTTLRIGSPLVTLQGTGAINLTNNLNNAIFGNSGAFQLINKTNTIDGAGQLGAAQLTFVNSGLVDANQPNALILNTSGNLMVNTGTLQASNTGGLSIQSTAIRDNGGTVQALVAGSHVDLVNSTIMGGTLKTANGGVIQTAGGSGGLDGITFGTLKNAGTVVVNDQTTLFLAGTINNAGTINENQQSTSGATRIIVNSQTAILSGAGKVNLSNNFLNEIYGTSGNNQLINVNNIISGAGQIGGSQLTLINQSAGVINANQPAGLLVPGLLVVDTSNNILTNQGLMESTNTGGLRIFDTVVNNAGGTLTASGAGTVVDLAGSTIQGGTLVTAGGGVIETVPGNGALDGITNGVVNNKGTLQVNSQTILSLIGTINNTGLISELQAGNSGSTQIRIASQSVSLTGGGKVTLSNNGLNYIQGTAASNQLINVNNTISGAGQIGNGTSMFLVNQGLINANQAVSLTLNTGTDIVSNTGTLEGTGTGGLVISSTTVNNTGGTIEAVGATAHVDLLSAGIEGGLLTTSGGGVIQTIDRGSALDGLTSGSITNKGTFQVVDNTSVTLVGTINNTGTVSENSAGSNTQIRIGSQSVVLTGAGKLLMSDNVNNLIFGNNSSFTLTNAANTIAGSGQIGQGASMFLVNQSLINANQNAALIVNTGANVVTNTGTMEATGTVVQNGGLVIQSTAVNNAGGTIQALGALAHVNLDGGVVEGGILNTTGGALIMTVGGGGRLDGLTSGALTNKGSVLVNDHTSLSMVGAIANTGTIKENATSGSGATNVVIGQTVTLSGAGQFQLTDNPNNTVSGGLLINQGNTIGGAGQFGNGGMEFINSSGIIQGTGGNALVLNLGSGNGVNNVGAQINAKGAGGVILSSGIFTNNGAMQALDGSSLVFQAGVFNTNLAEGDLVGGTWVANSTGHGATLEMTGGPVINDAAVLTLSGAGSSILAGTGQGGTPYTAVEQTLTNVTAAGQLQVLALRNYTTTLNLNDSGIVRLGGGTFQAAALTVSTGGSAIGFGTVSDAPLNNGKIEANGGLLDVTGSIAGTGALQIDNAATLELGGAATEAANFAAAAVGTLKFDTSTSYTGNIGGLILGDALDLGDIAPAAITHIGLTATTLTITYSGHPNLVYNVSGAGIVPAANHFAISSDGGAGTLLTLAVGPTPPVAGSTSGGTTQSVSTTGTKLVPGSDPSWVGGSGNSFNTAANWNPASVPGAADTAVIGAGFTVVSSQSNTVSTLSVGAGSTLSISSGTFGVSSGTATGGIAASGTITIGNGTTLALGGSITNAGTINDVSTGNNTDIVFTQTSNVLSGGGKIVMSSAAGNRIYATNPAFVFENVDNKITGSGQLGNGQMTLLNDKFGVINANQAATPLTVNTGGNAIVNTGTMEATTGGDLNILSPVNNAGGTITAVGAGSIVFLGASVVGGTVSTSAGGSIQSASGGVLDGLGLHPVTNSSAIQVNNGVNLTLLGTIVNNSSINLNATSLATNLRIGSPIVTLKGTGTINLTNNVSNQIFGNQGNFQLVNLTNRIAGAGQLGGAQLTFVNSGVVDATQNLPLVLNTSGNALTNTGTLQASGTGGLSIQSTVVVNTGGTVQAVVPGSHVDLGNGSTIQGGTLAGFIQTVGGNGGLDGISAGAIANTGTVKVNDLTILSLAGTINNSGTIQENQVSTNGSTQIRIASQTVSLSGAGQVNLSNSSGNEIFGNVEGNTLINVDNTISGAGQLGSAQLTLINQAAGIINANQNPTFFQSGELVLNTSGNVMVNAGTMEATAAGGLLIQSTAVQNSGLIEAVGATAHVDLSGADIEGGTLTTSGGGIIDTTGNSTLDGITAGTLNNTGLLMVGDLTILSLQGVIANTGTIFENQISAGGSTQIRIASQTVTLQGGGQLLMSDNASNLIFANTSSETLVNVDNSISGAGQLGDGGLALVNQAAGTINANTDTALVINGGGRIAINGGLMEGTGTGGLVISGTTVNNAGGTIEALGNGSVDLPGIAAVVDLQSAYIEGGSLTTVLSGRIHAIDRGSVLDGITAGVIANTGTLQIDNGQALSLVGTINNAGVITEAAFGNNGNTDLRIVGQSVVLQGGGGVLMSNNIDNRIYGTAADDTFTNVNNTISGAGQIGTGTSMFMINQAAGVINANQKTAMVINFGADLMTNAGLIESTGVVPFNGGMVLQNTAFNNAGGTIAATGAFAHVDLSGAYIEGGTLTSSGGGIIQTAQSTRSTLDGVTSGQLNNTGTIVVNDTSILQLTGTISNTGTILQSAFSANSNTDVVITGQQAILSGAGQWTLSDNANNRIYGSSSGSMLVNQGNTISGAGQFGTGGMEFTNAAGIINATGVNALLINLGQGNGVNNAGATMSATGAGGLVIQSGIITNNGIMAANDGSAFTYQSGVANTNLSEGDLVGGTWKAMATGHGATLSMTGGPIVDDAAILVLSGAGSVIQAGSGSGSTPYQPLESTLSSIAAASSLAAAGQLQVLAGRAYSSTQDLDNSGTIQLGGGAFQTNSLTIETGALLTGFGTVNNGVIDAGAIEAKGGKLTMAANVTGTGTLQADAAANLTLNGAASSTGTVVNNGTVTLAANASLDVSGAVNPASIGIFLLNNASVLELAGDKGVNNKMSFIGTGQLVIDASSQFGNNVGLGTYTGPQLQNFGVGDSIDLKDLGFAGAVIDSYTAASGLLQLHSGGTLSTLLFQNASLGAGSFHLANDGGGHTLLTHS